MKEYTIDTLIPHKGRMRLIDQILSVNQQERSLTSQVQITSQDTFFDDGLGGVPSYVSFEYMAQSISALAAIMDKRNTPQPGVILSISNLTCTQDIFPEHSIINVCVKENCVVGDLFTFDCVASIADKTVVTCTLLVMETKSLEELARQGGGR
ncbi:MAG: hypothetical protein J6K76_08935 [Spirochaetaceae bacterium]|nr:hypothetical protein [Spirochaetaceae bacterium]